MHQVIVTNMPPKPAQESTAQNEIIAMPAGKVSHPMMRLIYPLVQWDVQMSRIVGIGGDQVNRKRLSARFAALQIQIAALQRSLRFKVDRCAPSDRTSSGTTADMPPYTGPK